VPLSDGAGLIEAVGSGVQEFAVGDRVIGSFFESWVDGRQEARYGRWREVRPQAQTERLSAQRSDQTPWRREMLADIAASYGVSISMISRL
jgi:hypothetical protein